MGGGRPFLTRSGFYKLNGRRRGRAVGRATFGERVSLMWD
jgi:hypothetical protein